MDALKITFISSSLAILIISLALNLFIIIVNILDYIKNRKLPLSDQLVCGVSFFYLLHGFVRGYVLYTKLSQVKYERFSDEYDYNNKVTQVFLYLNLCSLFFSALLSTHFCLKIVNINHKFYIGLQRRFPKLFPWFIITFLLGYFFLSLYSALERNPECLLNTTSAAISLKKSAHCSWSLLIFMTISVLCLSVFSVSALTILISLFKHIRRIQGNSEGSKSPNMAAHIKAVKTISILMAADVLIFTCVFTIGFREKYLVDLLVFLIPIGHILSSYFLIKGTKKLDKTMVQIMGHFACIRDHTQ